MVENRGLSSTILDSGVVMGHYCFSKVSLSVIEVSEPSFSVSWTFYEYIMTLAMGEKEISW
jgi:hypothetical protein